MNEDFWNSRYGESEGFVYGEAPNDFVVALAPLIPEGPVLCLAAGEGRNEVFLAKQGHAVTAVDLSSVGLQKAAALAERNGVALTCVQADLATYDLGDGQWAGIVAIWAHVPPPVRKAIHKVLSTALMPGGVFLHEGYRPEQLALKTGGPPVAEVMMTRAQALEELADLDLLLVQNVERHIEEGWGHKGNSATLQVVARRPAD